jgi:hypothetical protein
LNYLSIYATVPLLQNLPSYFAYKFNKVEVGFFYLVSLFRMTGLHFNVFIGVVTGVSLLLVDRFIRRFSPLPLFSLAFFFAVYSLTYMESGIRQLLAICIGLGWVLHDWARGRRWSAMVGVLVAASMHSSALLLFVLPILFRNEKDTWPFSWSLGQLGALLGGVLAVSAALLFVNLQPILERIPSAIGPTLVYYYMTTRSFSLLALLNRLLFAALAVGLAWRARERLSMRERLLLKLYLLGLMVYLLCMSVDLIASRTNVYFRVVEFALLPALLYHNRDARKWVSSAAAVLVALLAFIYVKDMRAIMGFSQYYETDVLSYPYVTVFDPAQLLDVRYIPVKYEPYMNQAAYGQFDFEEYYRQVPRKPSLTSPVLPY